MGDTDSEISWPTLAKNLLKCSAISCLSLTDLSLIDNKIFMNVAMFGGVLRLNNFHNLIIRNNLFFKNMALGSEQRINKEIGRGGCFFFENNNMINYPPILIINNNFVLSMAEIGGIFFSSDRHSLIDTTKFRNENKIKRTKVNLI